MNPDKRNSRIAYLALIAFALFVLLIVWTGYRTSHLVLYISSAVAALTLAYAVSGLVADRTIESRSHAWKVIGVVPLIVGAAFIGFWILLIVGFALR